MLVGGGRWGVRGGAWDGGSGGEKTLESNIWFFLLFFFGGRGKHALGNRGEIGDDGLLMAGIADDKTNVFLGSKLDSGCYMVARRHIDRISDVVAKFARRVLGRERVAAAVGEERRHDGA